MTEKLTAEQTIRALRRRRARGLLIKLGLFVALPTAISAGYLGFFASDAYESVALYSIQAAEGRSVSPMESLIGVAGISSGGRDTLTARDFALSREMLRVLNEKTHLLDHYRSKSIDYFSRLSADDSFEDAFEYYLERVKVSYDSNSSVLTLRVQAYTSEKAVEVGRAILEASEAMVNELSEKARADQIKLAERDVDKAEARLSASRRKLVELQQKYGEFNPANTAQAALSIRTELEGELARAKAEYATLRSYMAEDSPMVIAAKERANSLSAQISRENTRLVNPKDNEGLNTSYVEFETVQVEKEFATQAYQSALASLEVARAEAARQHRYLATIAPPSQPDESTYPRRALLILTTFLVSLLLFGIGSLGLAALKEHARL